MSEMVDRMARAILATNNIEPGVEELAWARDIAVTCLEIAREPTEEMLAAVIERPDALIAKRTSQGHADYAAQMNAAVAIDRLVLAQQYQAMIDAALATPARER